MALEPTAYQYKTNTLEAVNIHLNAIGVANISSILAQDRNVDVEAALRSLLATSRSVQMEGWHFNTYRKYKLSADPDDGTIVLPANTLRVESSYVDEGCDFVERDGKLWDNDNNTFDIGRDVYVDYVLLLPFEQIPEYARWYITVQSTRRFATGRINSSSSYNFTKVDEDEAKSKALAADALLIDRTAKKASKHVRRMRNRRNGG